MSIGNHLEENERKEGKIGNTTLGIIAWEGAFLLHLVMYIILMRSTVLHDDVVAGFFFNFFFADPMYLGEDDRPV